jgi:hypothetical protein
MKKFGFATIVTGGIVGAFLGLGAPAQAVASPADASPLTSSVQNATGSDHQPGFGQQGPTTPIVLPNGDIHPSH